MKEFIKKNERIRIVEYDDKYAREIVEFIKDIAINEFEYKDWESYFNKMTFEEYKNKGSKFWIAINEKDEIIGTIGGLRISNDEIKMNSLYVHKSYRKLGIAKELYELFIEFTKEYNYKSVTLRTFFKFTNAINFYENMGYKKYNQDEESYFYRKNMQKECCMKEKYEEWMSKFMESWKDLRWEKTIELLAKDVKYYENPIDRPCDSFDEVVKLWEVVRENQKDITYKFNIVSYSEEVCIINWQMERIFIPSNEKQSIDGVFQISLNSQGLCSSFKQ